KPSTKSLHCPDLGLSRTSEDKCINAVYIHAFIKDGRTNQHRQISCCKAIQSLSPSRRILRSVNELVRHKQTIKGVMSPQCIINEFTMRDLFAENEDAKASFPKDLCPLNYLAEQLRILRHSLFVGCRVSKAPLQHWRVDSIPYNFSFCRDSPLHQKLVGYIKDDLTNSTNEP